MATCIAPSRIVALIQRNFRALNFNRMKGASIIQKNCRQHLTRPEQNRNIHQPRISQARTFAMSEPAPMTDNDHYEQACSQAIAMCDGNLRSTIKALIMANEYLEAELQQLQAGVSNGDARRERPRARCDAA
jgi:hypothetical protein